MTEWVGRKKRDIGWGRWTEPSGGSPDKSSMRMLALAEQLQNISAVCKRAGICTSYEKHGVLIEHLTTDNGVIRAGKPLAHPYEL